jgi:hypothetical protein
MRLVAREVQHGAADHRIHGTRVPRQRVELAHDEVGWRQRRRQARRQRADVLDGVGHAVDAETLAPARQQEAKVPPLAAAGVEHTAR